MDTPTPKDDLTLTDRVYDGMIELLATVGGPEAIIAYRSPDAVQDRAYELVYAKKERQLTDAESTELDAFHQREHIVRMAKIRAHKMMKQRAENAA